MSDRDGVGIDGDVGDLEVARALARAIREAGRALASEPRRVQGMVNDLLGIESRTRRAEIDAVVLAAEESIPEDLLAGRIDLETAQARLHDRGLDEGVALFAVQVWQFALGMLASDAQPPSLRNSLDGSSRTVPADPAATLPAPGPKAVPAASSTASGTGDERPKKPIRRLILAGTAVVLVLCLVLLGAAVWLARDNGGTDAAPASTDAPASTVRTTTTTTATSSTPPPVIMQVGFDVEATPLGELTRTWTVEDGELVATLVFENRTDAPTSDRYYEAVPKSLAATASLIKSEPPHITINEDPVIAWDLTIEPGANAEVTYVVALSADLASESLEAMEAEQLAAAEAFRVEFATAPLLVVATPDNQTVTSGSVTVTGTTDPTATLTVNGDPIIDFNPDGTWSTNAELQPGLTTLTFVATSRFGVPSQFDLQINFEPPVEPPPSTSRPRTTTTTTRPSTTTQPPPPPATTTSLAPAPQPAL